MEQRSCFLHGEYTGKDECPGCANHETDALERKVDSEVAFNAGFDSAVRSILRPAALKTVRFTHPQYLKDRRTKFEEWNAVRLKGTT